MNTASTDSDGW